MDDLAQYNRVEDFVNAENLADACHRILEKPQEKHGPWDAQLRIILIEELYCLRDTARERRAKIPFVGFALLTGNAVIHGARYPAHEELISILDLERGCCQGS